MIKTDSQRESGNSVLSAQPDDDDDEINKTERTEIDRQRGRKLTTRGRKLTKLRILPSKTVVNRESS